ncbi:MAG: polysaccharide lyase family 1 protein [Flavisolibacter sp.]
MKKQIISIFICITIWCCISCAQQKKSINNSSADTTGMVTSTQPDAFPGAEGFGRYATGGRGGKTVIVTNLNDHGTGSFREAVQMNVPRIIVFAVSGTIHLESKLTIKGNVTIAGQTAPGDGICLADYSVSLGGDNIIVRFIRFRMGDKNQKGGMVDGNGGDDAFGGYGRNSVIIDHCSMSWSTDEVFSVYGGDNVTLQWNMIYEPLNYSYHFEKGDTGYEHHGYGAIWGGKHLTAHHNLFAHCNSRNPRFNGIRSYPAEFVDYRNNVIYNWGHNNVYGGEGGTYNIVNNYYRYGPETVKSVRGRIVNPSKLKSPVIPFGKYFVHGNFVDGYPDVTSDNRLGVQMGDGTEQDRDEALVTTPFSFAQIVTQNAEAAYQSVLQNAGATAPQRDTLDQRIIKEVKNRTGHFIDVQGGFPHGTEYELTVSAWPSLKSKPAPEDADKDGIPDEWEKKNGLNAADPSDAMKVKNGQYYTNIELYINSLVDHLKN